MRLMTTRSRGARAVAAAAILVAAVSAVLGVSRVWPRLDTAHRAYAVLSSGSAERFPARDLGLDPAVFDFYRRNLKPGERFFVRAPQSGVVSLWRKARPWAWYWLAPAIEEGDLAKADAIVSYDDDPSRLGVPLGRIVRFPGKPRYSVAWIRR
jgi:hypothetical protein